MVSATLALAVDTRGGMMFNHRRQARDAELVADAVGRFGGGGIFISPYSARLLEGYASVTVCDDPITDCTDGSLCFIESPALLHDVRESFSRIVIYRFGIPYPADECLPLDLAALGYVRISRDKAATLLHPRLTREVYERR